MIERKMFNDKTHTSANEGLEIADILKVVRRRKVLILTTIAFSTLAAAAINLKTPNRYTATATLMPVENNHAGILASVIGSMGGGLGQLASQAGLASGGTNDKFVTILQARTLSESVINHLNLLPILFDDQWDAQRKSWKEPWLKLDNKKSPGPTMQAGLRRLEKLVTIERDKRRDLVNISFTAKDPELAAMVANQYVVELDRFLKENALSTAKRNRLFVEGQLEKAQKDMAGFELAMKDFQQKNKVVSLDVQAEVAIKTYSEIKAKLMASELELGLLEKSTFGADPRIALKREEIRELTKQLENVESGSGAGPLVSFEQAPKLGLSFARLKRELLVREKVFELLTQQYEMAKIQEAQEDISFQILDHAIAPEKKSGPKRLLNTLAAFLVSTVLGVFLAFTIEFWQRLKITLHSEVSD